MNRKEIEKRIKRFVLKCVGVIILFIGIMFMAALWVYSLRDFKLDLAHIVFSILITGITIFLGIEDVKTINKLGEEVK